MLSHATSVLNDSRHYFNCFLQSVDFSAQLPDYLRMAIANRKSLSLRIKGDHDGSDVVIQDTLRSIAFDATDIRSHCSYVRLLLSQSENAILRKQFDKATSYLTASEVTNVQLSMLELQVVRLKNTVLWRISRYQADFEHARYCLEGCLMTLPGDSSRNYVIYHLAGVYCELRNPEKAQELVLEENKWRRAQPLSRTFRRLALPLVEAYIEQRAFERAKTVLQELLDIFDGIVRSDVLDQLGHVRSMIGLARVSWYEARLSETRQNLETTLALTEKYKTFSKRNFYIGVIYLFLSVVNFELGEDLKGWRTLASANDIFNEQIPRHFALGMGSYFPKHLRSKTR